MTEDPNLLIVQPDGPNVITGDVAVVTPAGVREMKTAVLCRCGHSSNKPFCDGTHVKIGFIDPARLPAGVETAAASAGRLTITPEPNGPNACEGPLTVRGAGGTTIPTMSPALCRCGGSRTKPFCDGTHATIGFRG